MSNLEPSVHASRSMRDGANILMGQITDIMYHIGISPSRQRVADSCASLQDTLVKHSREIADNTPIQVHLLSTIVELAANNDGGVGKAVAALETVLDANIMDNDAKRNHCTITCTRILEHESIVHDVQSCDLLIGIVRSLIVESSFTAPEVMTTVCECAIALVRDQSRHTVRAETRAAAFQVLTYIVTHHAIHLKAVKQITESMRALSPSYLCRETINADSAWVRTWTSKLLAEIIRHSVFELSSENAESLVREVETQLINSEGDDNAFLGVLELVETFSSVKVLSQAYSWNPNKWRQCLFETDWSASSAEVQCAVVRAIVAITNMRISDIVGGALVTLCQHHLCRDFSSACKALCAVTRHHAKLVHDAERGEMLDCVIVVLLDSAATPDVALAPEVAQLLATLLDPTGFEAPEKFSMAQERVFQTACCLFREAKFLLGASILQAVDESLFRGPNQASVAFLQRLTDDSVVPWSALPPEHLQGASRLASVVRTGTSLTFALAALVHLEPAVRLEAAKAVIVTCEQLIQSSRTVEDDDAHSRRLDNVVQNAVELLLDAAVADIDASVRLAIMKGLSAPFDPYLSMPDNLQSILMAKNDTVHEIGITALGLLCRLLPSHPAFVHPVLNRFQDYALKEIEARDSTVAEIVSAALLLRTCAANRALVPQPKHVEQTVMERLVRQPFASRMLTEAFLSLLRTMLDTYGLQHHVEGPALVHALKPIICDGHTALLRSMALDTLASMVRTLGVALETQLFSEVYNMCGGIVVNESKEDDETRKSAALVLSVLGAMNPVKIRAVTRAFDAEPTPSADEGTSNDLLPQAKAHHRSHPHIAERYPSIVLFLLIKTMQLASDPKQQKDALRCAYETLQASPANQKSHLMTQLVPQLRRWLRDPEKSFLHGVILKIFTDLVGLLQQFKDTIPAHIGTDILKSVQSLCYNPQASQPPLNILIVELLDQLARALPMPDIRDHRWAVEYVHQRLVRDRREAKLVVCVVKALESFSNFLQEKDKRHVLPHVLDCLDIPPRPSGDVAGGASTQRLQDVRLVNAACYDFLAMLIERHTSLVKDFCAQVVHKLMELVDGAWDEEERGSALHAAANLVAAVGGAANRFIPHVQRLCDSRGLPRDCFKLMVDAIRNGAQKVKLPPAKQEEAASLDCPLTVVSNIPTLSRADFEREVRSILRLDEVEFEVLGVSHPGGQTVVHFQFAKHLAGAETKLAYFMRKANDAQSTLRRTLGIISVEQRPQQSLRLNPDFVTQLAALPETRVRRKKEFTWMNWMQVACLNFLRNSPFQPFRVLSTLTPSNMWLVKEVFPFAVGAVLSQVDTQQRASILQTFNTVILKAPNDIRQILFSLAEYLESERGEKKPVVSKVSKTVTCTVERDAPDQKFGINYDQDNRGIIVTKLAPDGPGMRAGVPVLGVLQSINQQKVHTVNEIPGLIRGATKIYLVFTVIEEVRRIPETKPLMSLAEVAKAAAESEFHAKEVYFSEVLLQQLTKNLGEGKNRKDAEAQQILQVVESLMKCYNRLGLPMEAKGLVKMIAVKFTENIIAPENFGFDEADTLEQLHWWSDALRLYQSRFNDDSSVSSLMGMLRCYDAMGEIERIQKTAETYWPALDEEARAQVAPHRAAAALALGDWDSFDEAAGFRPESLGTVERGVYLLRHGQKDALVKFIRDERDARFEQFSETFDDSYLRCIDLLAELQHLTHLEEIVQYQFSASDERRATLRGVWRRRAAQLTRQPRIWKTMVTLNSLVLTPEEDLLNRVDCINVCSKQGWVSYAEHLLQGFVGGQQISVANLSAMDPNLTYVYLKHLYNTNRRVEAHTTMTEILQSVHITPGDANSEVWGRCWFLFGEWTVQLNSADVPIAIEALCKATELSPRSSSAFHSLGILHYERSRDASQPAEARHESCVAAVNALINSVQLSSDGKNSVMQDMLRILTIWFSHGGVPIVNEAVQSGMLVIPDHVWLRVIPQLIARMGINSHRARAMLAELLIRIGTAYPHACIYPITVSEKSAEIVRKRMAEQILTGIRTKCDQLVKEASLISNELVRIAILWSERWHAQIQAAAHKQDDAAEILRILQPLFDELDHGTTPNEKNFEKSFGQTLKRAKTSLTSKALDQAWQLLKQVYSSVTKLMAERKLVMSDVSPVLDNIHKSIVAIPGTFDPTKPVISISRFQNKIIVMSSKQKPRRFGMDGSDGKLYRFLLKGHEDLRQDERVMQFLDLINTIFSGDSASTTLELFVPRYAVIPLTDNVGLIGWVENTETIYRMLETRRQDYNISVYDEVNLIMQKGRLRHIEDYHKLGKHDRKSLLHVVMSGTPSDELSRIIWDKNDGCEQWLEYRRLYGHTLAIMSMVGYVLGLGDRHLNNLMLQQGGAVVHIDFGDCFEVAMHRAMYAEAVPFRLTRILVNALGVTGVDGVYRHTCEHVMKLLRRHKENLLSVLEAFIYDPLINWKLAPAVTAQQPTPGAAPTPTAVDAHGVPTIIADLDGPTQAKQPALSCTVRGTRGAIGRSVAPEYEGEQELRNQQGDAALLRVHAKLSGQDFDTAPTSSGTGAGGAGTPSIIDRAAMNDFFAGESVKDSVAGPLLATYLASQQLQPGTHVLDVSQQVERLIQEATSLDNLAEAFITGWAPFW